MRTFAFESVTTNYTNVVVFKLANGKKKVYLRNDPYIKKRFASCDECCGFFKKDDLKTIEIKSRWGETLRVLCPSCLKAHTCVHCGQFIQSAYDLQTIGEEKDEYCRTCRDHFKKMGLTKVCAGCGSERWTDKEEWVPLPFTKNFFVCSSCATNGENASIRGYHTSKNKGIYPFFSLPGENRENNLHIGFELEVTDGDHKARPETVVSRFSKEFPFFAHYETDCSIGRGVEIITNPSSVRFIDSLGERLDKTFKAITKEDGYRSHVGAKCGLHIHLDRVYFNNSRAAIARLVYLFSKFRTELTKFSRRNYRQLHWADIPTMSHQDWLGKPVNPYKQYLANCNRYRAVNLANSNTIEIRLWRGTLNYQVFKATLKLTEILAQLAKEKTATEIVKLTWDDIMAMDSDVKEYYDTCDRQYRCC